MSALIAFPMPPAISGFFNKLGDWFGKDQRPQDDVTDRAIQSIVKRPIANNDRIIALYKSYESLRGDPKVRSRKVQEKYISALLDITINNAKNMEEFENGIIFSKHIYNDRFGQGIGHGSVFHRLVAYQEARLVAQDLIHDQARTDGAIRTLFANKLNDNRDKRSGKVFHGFVGAEDWRVLKSKLSNFINDEVLMLVSEGVPPLTCNGYDRKYGRNSSKSTPKNSGPG